MWGQSHGLRLHRPAINAFIQSSAYVPSIYVAGTYLPVRPAWSAQVDANAATQRLPLRLVDRHCERQLHRELPPTPFERVGVVSHEADSRNPYLCLHTTHEVVAEQHLALYTIHDQPRAIHHSCALMADSHSSVLAHTLTLDMLYTTCGSGWTHPVQVG